MTRVAQVREGVDSRFKHFFGGPHRHKGTTPKGCKAPLHLLYTFDSRDPSLPVRIPGVRYLPLYYSFVYNGGACGYRVKSDTEIEALYMQTRKVEPGFPFEKYPPEFPERRVRLRPISYEEHKTLVFSIEAGQEALSKSDCRLIVDDLHYPFTQLGGIHFMWQGVPSVPCPNPKCEYSKYTCFMDVFAVVWNEPHHGVFLWDTSDSMNDSIQIIFLICRKCFSIHACNRCD